MAVSPLLARPQRALTARGWPFKRSALLAMPVRPSSCALLTGEQFDYVTYKIACDFSDVIRLFRLFVAWSARRRRHLQVNVTWNKRKFEDIELNPELPPLVFKMQLFSLTGVQPDRQKIIVKGGILKDDGDWSTLGVKQVRPWFLLAALCLPHYISFSVVCCSTDSPRLGPDVHAHGHSRRECRRCR